MSFKQSGNDITELHKAVQPNSTKKVTALLEKQADVNAQDINGETSLYSAVLTGSSLIVGLFLQAKANTELKLEFSGTPLQQAAASDNLEIACMLLEAGANPAALKQTAFLIKFKEPLITARATFFMRKHIGSFVVPVKTELEKHIPDPNLSKIVLDYTAPLDTSILTTATQELTKTRPSKTA